MLQRAHETSQGEILIRFIKLNGKHHQMSDKPSQVILYRYILLYTTIKIWTIIIYVMAPYSSTLAWRIPWTEEPGRLQSMGSLGVGHDWVTSLSLFTFMHWRRKWQPTPVFLPGESQGRGSRLWGRTESDTTEAT